ncbi:MAG: hypothetical protein ACE5JJ_05085 [Nitrospinota bacterium]
MAFQDAAAVFLQKAAQHFGSDERFQVEMESGGLELRLRVAERVWYEMTAFEEEGRLRVGLALSDRIANEAIEQAILDSKDTLSEFCEAGFDDAGEEEPHEVKHFHDGNFRFCVELPCDEARFGEGEFYAQSLRVLEGLYDAFQEHVEGE